MKGALGSPIETVLQVVELSLLPPNSKGIMPAGIQRFPFEFPIPSTLPTTVFIRDRLEIFYQVCATIRKSTQLEHQDAINPANWIDWARRNSSRKKWVACSPMRIVRAMESVMHHNLALNSGFSNTTQASIPSLSLLPTVSSGSSSLTTGVANGLIQDLPWNRRGLGEYQGTLDEQHDQLAQSLSGRTSSNLTQPIDSLDCVQGIRYKIGVDRTAIALGTSIGIELMIEPTMADVTVKSVVLNISENRKYAMKVPSDHSWSSSKPKIRKACEGAKMVLKWAYGYEVENEDGEMVIDKKVVCHQGGSNGDRYVRKRSSSSQFLAYFDPPQPGHPNNKFFLGNHAPKSDIKPDMMQDSAEEFNDVDGYASSTSSASKKSAGCDMINLKELNQTVKLGEYFGGRFVMPVPDCSNILHPSMDYESITIIHWMQLVVTLECNGKTFNLLLDSPSRILDCRVVSVDDDCQTILPPPPSYQPGDVHLRQENNWSTCSTFWEQREAITSVSGWGHCVPCPCQYKKLKQLEKKCQGTTTVSNPGSKKTPSQANSNVTTIGACPPNLLPEWGPPPSYSEN